MVFKPKNHGFCKKPWFMAQKPWFMAQKSLKGSLSSPKNCSSRRAADENRLVLAPEVSGFGLASRALLVAWA